MTISRSKIALGLMFLLAACGREPSRPMAEIILSDESEQQLGEKYSDRLIELSHEPAKFFGELEDAGFDRRPRAGDRRQTPVDPEPSVAKCGTMVRDGPPIYAVVNYCLADGWLGDVTILRFGISRKPLTVD